MISIISIIRMHSYISIALIILFFPLIASAHGTDDPHLDINPTTLPGERTYFFERISEWFEVNIFTVSTKKKQAKKLELAGERVAELEVLLGKEDVKNETLRSLLGRYQGFLRDSQDMAEKIITLDGAEVEIGREFEKQSRTHEILLARMFNEADRNNFGTLQEFLATARTENEDMFKFLVEKYQFTDEDIRIHQAIAQKHIALVENKIDDLERDLDEKQKNQTKLALEFLAEAKKFKEAGLNAQAYELADRAKNIVYSIVLQIELEN